MKQHQTMELIERLGILLRAEQRKTGSSFDLQPIHIQVLDYLNRCNKYSNAPAGIVKYFGITKGTVSQSIKVLEKKSLVIKVPDTTDKRSVHLILTTKGKDLLNKSSITTNANELLELIDKETIRSLDEGLTKILASLQKKNSYNTFGVCETCRHLLSDKKEYLCGLTREKLSANDTTKICQEHEFSKAV